MGEPLKTGLVANLAWPGGNLTGLSLLTSEPSGKRLELLATVVRTLPRLAVLMNPANPVHDVFLEETRVAARRSNARLQPLPARHPKEIEQAFGAAVAERAVALIVFDDPVLWSHRIQCVALVAKHRLPAMYGYRQFVDDGGLISYGPDGATTIGAPRRQDPGGREPGASADRATHQVRAGHQPEDGPGARADHRAVAPAPRGHGAE